MAKAKLSHNVWVLVADGGRALVLRNEGDEQNANLKVERVYELDNPPSREQGSDRPARTNDAFGGHRSAIEEKDWHRVAEQLFMQRLAGDLDKDCAAGKFDTLVVAAPPIALGEFRKAESATLKKATIADVHKDFTHMPIYEIEKAVLHALAQHD